MDVLKGLLGKGDKEKTFKELKHIKEGTKRFELKTWLMATLGKGDLRGAVKLPPGEDKGLKLKKERIPMLIFFFDFHFSPLFLF